MSQLSFDLPLKKKAQFLEEDFCFLPENLGVISSLKLFFAQEDFEEAKITSFIIFGEKFSGKTHILHIFAQKYAQKCQFLDKKNLANLDLANFFQANHFYILEDFDEVKDEELLFHLFNAAFRSKAFLIFSGQEMPDFKIKDVKSRFDNIISSKILGLSLESMQELLFFLFSQRQFKISPKLVDEIAKNIDREYEMVFNVVQKVEKFYGDNKKMPKISDL